MGEGIMYDYAQEESIIALSRRPTREAMPEPKINGRMEVIPEPEIINDADFSTPYDDQEEIYENAGIDNGMSPMSNFPPPCVGHAHEGYVEYDAEDIYLNDEAGYEQEIYTNTMY
jgi:hypothetical protein